MNIRFLFAFAATASLLLTVAARADGPADAVTIYLSPDATTAALQRVKPDDARLADAKPVADADKAALGWETLSLVGPFDGFVATSKTKDSTINAGAPIFLTTDDASPVLGNAPEAPPLKVRSMSANWSTVSFPGPLTVYFVKPAAKPAVINAVPAAAMAPAPVLAPAPMADTTAPVKVTAATPPLTASAPTRVAAVPAPKQADPADVPRYYYGVLALRTNPKISGPTNAQYLLYGNQGELVALVDLGNVVLPKPLVAYLDKPVKIYGTAYANSGMPKAVIYALTMQEN